MRKLTILSLFAIFLLACSNDDFQENLAKTISTNSTPKDYRLIDRDAIDINELDAINVSQIFFGKENKNPTLRSTTIPSVETITDNNNNPLLYIINYSNNNGFMIISATKKYQPVLAYADKGNFSIDTENEGAEMFLNSYKASVQEARESKSDSLRHQYAAEWNLFEQPLEENTLKMASDIYTLKEQERRKWEAQGYSCQDFGAASSYMSPDQYYNFRRDVCEHTFPEYDCTSVNLLLMKSTSTIYGPLLRTEWWQADPFNIDAPNGKAGCVPIAIAQIVRYHQWPTSYNWNQIQEKGTSFDSIPQGTPELYRFIKDIRSFCNAKYHGKDGTSASHHDAVKALKRLGYTAQLKDYDAFNSKNEIAKEIREKRPVFMDGADKLNSSWLINFYSGGHAWVCDGYKSESTQFAVAMLSDPLYRPGRPGKNNPSYMFYSGFTDTKTYLHMNWGWGASDKNGWYYSNNVNPKPESNFQYHRKAIYIKPNK